MVNGLQGMLRPPDPDPPLGGLLGLLRQALDPTTPGWTRRGVPGLVRGVVEGLQRNPVSTVADFSPVGDAKALGYDAPNAFAQGNTLGGMLALASAVPGIPALAKGVPEKIANTAIKLPDGSIYQGHIHALARSEAMDAGALTDGMEVTDGFLTNTGRFVDRAEARRIAEGAAQVSDDIERPAAGTMFGGLDSDDLRSDVLWGAPRGRVSGPDLPMDEASRMARAREMGFDVDTPLYHGTSRTFDAFDGEYARSQTGNPNAVLGHYFTNNPAEASRYPHDFRKSDGRPQVLPVFVRPGQQYQASYREMDDMAMELLRNPRNPTAKAAEFRQQLIDDGYDSLRARIGGMDEVVIFDPKNIRSRFARFDPAQSESSNLMAGLMGLLGTGALLRANSGDRER